MREATTRTQLLRFHGAVERDPIIDAWMKEHAGELGAIAHQWTGGPLKPGFGLSGDVQIFSILSSRPEQIIAKR